MLNEAHMQMDKSPNSVRRFVHLHMSTADSNCECTNTALPLSNVHCVADTDELKLATF